MITFNDPIERKFAGRAGYVALFCVSWIIPAMHLVLVDGALEGTRRFTGLMPATFLFLRWCGNLSWWGPVVIAGLFGLSWKYPRLGSTEVVAKAAICFYVLTVLYAAYCSLLLFIALQGM